MCSQVRPLLSAVWQRIVVSVLLSVLVQLVTEMRKPGGLLRGGVLHLLPVFGPARDLSLDHVVLERAL